MEAVPTDALIEWRGGRAQTPTSTATQADHWMEQVLRVTKLKPSPQGTARYNQMMELDKRQWAALETLSHGLQPRVLGRLPRGVGAGTMTYLVKRGWVEEIAVTGAPAWRVTALGMTRGLQGK